MPKMIDNVLVYASDIEPNTIEQAKQSATLPFVHGHVALMPDAHVGFGSTVGSVIPTKGAIIPGAIGVDIGCFRGDTRVPLLDGTQLTLAEMTAIGGAWWVYSVSAQGHVVPGRASAVRTRTDAELMRVTVSGGEQIVCTPDHPFMLSDGSYRQAKDLRFNESLMPLYRKWQTRDGYESVSNGKGNAQMTHRLVYEALHGTVPAGMVVHHRNAVHFDNHPTNLEAVEAKEHSRHHRRVGRSFDNASPDFQARRLAGIQRRADDPEQQAKMAAVGTANITAYMAEQPEHFREAVAGNGQRGAPYLAHFNTTPRACDECEHVAANPSALRWHKRREHQSNHKVMSVDTLDERADVYCLQVEDHHNFALAAGVFVHNCGMIAVETTLTASHLPDNLGPLHGLIREAVPAGMGNGHGDVRARAYPTHFPNGSEVFYSLDQKQQQTAVNQFGSLGGGNHFVEVCLDTNDHVWVVLHSGSRGIGNQLANLHIEEAKGLMKRYFIALPDPDLAYLVEGTPEFDAYINAMLWAQTYAMGNREAMMDAVLIALKKAIYPDSHIEGFGGGSERQRINCYHNYTEREHHNGDNVWVTRKGAIRARVGDKGIIPGSMGTSTFIVSGLGNESSYNSCSHGAGRRLSRGRARRELDLEAFKAQMAGQVWNDRDAEALLDEAPDAYKSIEQVMADSTELVTIEQELTSVLNYKGVDNSDRRKNRKARR